jgi:2-dehydropantoate 2-reductase
VPRCGVFGAGAVGCYVGGRLAAAGIPAALVGRAASMAELRANGLALSGIDGRGSRVDGAALAAAEDPALLHDADLVFVCVKSLATAEAARSLRGVLRPGCTVVSLQNGVRNAPRLREGLPGTAVLGGVVGFNVVRGTGTAFHQATSGKLLIEAGPGGDVAARVLRSAGFDVDLRRDILEVQWGKLLLNLNNAVNALSGIPLTAELQQRGYRRVLAAAQREALAAMRQAGIRAVRIGRVVPQLGPLVLSLPDWLFRVAAASMIDIDPQARSSMADDLERGRRTEIDDLNGEVVRLAEKMGVASPVNRTLVALVKAAEGAAKGSPRFSAAELCARVLRQN